jgi:hypothetical protein
MAAAVVNGSKRERVFGDLRAHFVNLTWNNGDTYNTGFKSVKSMSFEPTTAAASGLTRAQNAQGQTVITLVSGGALTGDLMLFGFA